MMFANFHRSGCAALSGQNTCDCGGGMGMPTSPGGDHFDAGDVEEVRREQAVLHGNLSQDQCDSVGLALGFHAITPEMATGFSHATPIREPTVSEALEMAARFAQAALDQRDEARRERDEALMRLYHSELWVDQLSDSSQALRTELMATRDALAEAENRYATIRAASVPKTPNPVPNPFRGFGHDPRRMGPL